MNGSRILRLPHGEAVTLLQKAWDYHGDRDLSVWGSPLTPIARTHEDQVSVTDNPLWDIVRWMPASRGGGRGEPLTPAWVFRDSPYTLRLLDAGIHRQALCSTYAYSIPSPGDLEWMKHTLRGRAVVETGAGSGYWAWQLEQSGIDVAAYDPFPVGDLNHYCKAGPYTTVLQDDASVAKHHPDRVLLLVWPPHDGSAATHALSSHNGDLLIYAGEGPGGCTADDMFYELLEKGWEKFSVAEDHVTYWGIHCQLAAYRRL